MLNRRDLLKRAAAAAAAVLMPSWLMSQAEAVEAAVDTDILRLPRFTQDVDELRTWNMDIRQILSDNAIKDGVNLEALQLEVVYRHQARKPPEVLTHCPGKNKSEWICPEQ